MFVYSCKKNELKNPKPPEVLTEKDDLQKILASDFFVQNRKVADMASERNNNASLPDMAARNSGEGGAYEYPDEVPMILGAHVPIPYTVPVMTEAYNIYYASGLYSVPVTDLYIKFSPVNEAQFALLEDSLDLDLYDYPLDYEVLADGDYYQQPGKGVEDMPEFYTTVPVDFQFPAGIPYTIMEQLHFPPNNVILEALAESIAAGGNYSSYHPNAGGGEVLMTREDNGEQLMNANHCDCYPDRPDLSGLPCYTNIEICEGGGGGGNPGGTPPGNPQPPGNPVPPSSIPQGNVVVWDTQLSQYLPVQSVRIRVKRGLRGVGKRNYFYTDANGNFVSQLGFSGSFKLNIKFKNATVSVRAVRAYRIKMSLNGVVDNRGKHQLNTNLHLQINRPLNINNKSFSYWTAANIINGIHTYTLYTAQEQIPHYNKWRLNFFITKNNEYYEQEAFVMAPMKRAYKKGFGVDDFLNLAKFAAYTAKAIKSKGTNVPAIVNAIYAAQAIIFQANHPDVILGYNTSYDNLSSNGIKQKIYEGLANGSLFMKTPKIYWKAYGEAGNKITESAFSAGQYALYAAAGIGDFQSSYPTMISMASNIGLLVYYSVNLPNREMWQIFSGWASYYGNFIVSREYPNQLSAPIKNQMRELVFSNSVATSHMINIEAWNPKIEGDVFHKTRKGIFNDIIDGAVEPPNNNVNDNFPGISNKNLYEIIAGSHPSTPNPGVSAQSFLILSVRLQVLVPSQTATITALFNSYN